VRLLAYAMSLAFSLCGCGPGEDIDAGPTDAGVSDGGSQDAGRDADVGTDAGLSDGGFTPWDGAEIPPVAWDVPPCVEDYGVLERQDMWPYGAFLLAASRGSAIAAWRGLVEGRSATLLGPDVLTDDDWSQAPPEMLDRGLSLKALAPFPAGSVSMLVQGRRVGESSRPFIRRVQVGTVTLADLGPDLYGADDLAWMAAEGSTLRIVALFAGRDASIGTDRIGFAEVQVDDSLAALSGPPWLVDERWNEEFAVATDGTDTLLVHEVEGSPVHLEAVPYDDAEIRAPVRSDAVPDAIGWGAGLFGLRAALDGDVVVALYQYEPFDSTDVSAVAELSLRTGELLGAPQRLGGACLIPNEIVSHPGGGVDIVRQPQTDCASYDYRVNTSHPLEVYVGLRRPISFGGASPLRLGAGAMAHDFQVVRDGDRLIVVWAESGPSTLPDEDTRMRRTVEGLFYAVLRCDGT